MPNPKMHIYEKFWSLHRKIIRDLIAIEHSKFLNMNGFCVPIQECNIQFLVCPSDNHMFILVLFKKHGVPERRMTEDHMIPVQLQCLPLVWQTQPPINVFGLIRLRDPSAIGH